MAVGKSRAEELKGRGYQPAGGGEIRAWEQGDKVEGTLVELRESARFPGSYLMDVRLDDGSIETYACPVILFSRLRAVPVNSSLYIECKGKVGTKGGQEAFDFEVLYKMP